MVVTRILFQAALRAAAVTLLTDYAASSGTKLQVYPGRPDWVAPPTAYVDRITESFEYPGSVTWRQRTPRAEVIVLFGVFDSKDAADQKDAFVDGFLDWVTDRVHAAGANTTIGLVSAEDEPAFSLDWRPARSTNGPDAIYYAVRLTLEGYAGG